MTTYVTRARGRRALVPGLAALTLLLTATACSGDSGGGSGDDPAAELADARAALDETPGVKLSLTTDELPQGTDGVLSATGIGTHAPAFEGDIKVVVNSITVDVPVVAVEGDVHATLPFTNQFVVIDPEEYGAPDPADLMSTDGGVSSWLTEVTDVTKGDEVRDGDQVLTSYAGTLPGAAVDSVIPSADEKADFAVSFTLTDDGLLAAADVTGPFYGSGGEVDYRLEVSDYGTEKDIAAP